jgi:hypothetical protein
MLRLMDKPQDTPTLPGYYRHKSGRGTPSSRGATTRAIKERLHGSVLDLNKLVYAADRAGQIADLPARMIEATMKRSANRSLAANTGEQVMQMR